MMISSSKQRIESVGYENEKELQKIVGNAPDLVDEFNKLHTVCGAENELSISAGNIDLFMISETGDVVVVETKLARNQESRRKVIAQIIDYISSLSELSYYELDNATKNRLSEIIGDIEAEIDLPKVIDDNLRNGRVKLIIAVDESNENLTRLTQFLADHTDFAVGLVEIKKYKDNDRELYVSADIVKWREAQDTKRIMGENEAAKSEGKSRYQLCHEFWGEFLEQYKKTPSRIYSNISPRYDSWLSAGAGVSSAAFVCDINIKKVRAEVCFNGNKEHNEALFDKLELQKCEIEKEFGAPLSWERLDNKKACRIAYRSEDMSIYNREDWQKMKRFFCEYMPRLELTIKERLKEATKNLT